MEQFLHILQGSTSIPAMGSPGSAYSVDDSVEREAVETLLSICKAPSPAGSENSMDGVVTSTEPWCLPGDPPPSMFSQISPTRSEHNLGFEDIERCASSPLYSARPGNPPARRESKLAQVNIERCI